MTKLIERKKFYTKTKAKKQVSYDGRGSGVAWKSVPLFHLTPNRNRKLRMLKKQNEITTPGCYSRVANALPTIILLGNTRGRRVARFLFKPIRYLNSLSDNYYEMMENRCRYGVSVLLLQELLGETSTSRVSLCLIADQENNVCASALNFDHVPEENSATCLLVRGPVWQETTQEQPAAAKG